MKAEERGLVCADISYLSYWIELLVL